MKKPEGPSFESVFAAAVPECLGFLHDRGFEMHREHEWLFHFDSAKTRVGTIIEKRRIGLWLGPHPSTLRPATPAPSISVIFVAEYHGVPRDIGLSIVNSPDEVRGVLLKLTELLKVHGNAMLNGDFSELPAVMAYAQEAIRAEMESWKR